jgi:hypothetical protein
MWLILLLSVIFGMLTACSNATSATHTDQDMISDLEAWLTEELDTQVQLSSWEPYVLEEDDQLPEATAYFHVTFERGDVSMERIYGLVYDYSRAFGWSLKEVQPINQGTWTVTALHLVDENRILEDLEGKPYFSGYSNGQMEQRRVLSASIQSREYDAAVGYDRVQLQVILNADDVHEVVDVSCEYLLDESSTWQLFAQDLSLNSVKVQSGVSDEILQEELYALKFYREEEDSTWCIGDLNRVSYEISSRTLDSDQSEEFLEVEFRGEGSYMYIAGTVQLDFRFSSGWYLYDSTLETETVETGMLMDSFVLGKEQLLDTILNEQPFPYDGMEELSLSADMLSNLVIDEIRISENGRFQTAYFTYDLLVSQTLFHIQGYGKYEIDDEQHLVVNTWNDVVDDMTYDLTGVWYADDLTEDYLAYYTLSLTDNQNGTLEGRLSVYGADLTDGKNSVFRATCSVLGNITYGTNYELLLENWDMLDDSTEISMPTGQYMILKDQLTIDTARSENCIFTKEQPSERISRTELSTAKNSGKLSDILQELLEDTKKNLSTAEN